MLNLSTLIFIFFAENFYFEVETFNEDYQIKYHFFLIRQYYYAEANLPDFNRQNILSS